MQYLTLQHERHTRLMRGMSEAQARHHETMMLIIRNLNTGRYEYNPSTGRYDRWVPSP